MYHCHTHFYLLGHHAKAFEIIKEMASFEQFTHTFTEGSSPDGLLIANADVVFADLQSCEGAGAEETVRTLIQNKRGDTELILFAEPGQIMSLGDMLSEVKDIWTTPMSDEEIRFRFLRWQQTYKVSKDFWQTSQYLESAINNIPNLIWYKDKNGKHEKVNISFCRTVNKSREQVEGQGHAYIWDVEQDDPACIESERQVMERKVTCISEEIIQTGMGERTLTTYKSPLYDLDGSVMGTVGVGIDVTKERAYEQELLKKNRIMETIFTSIDCGVVCHSLDGTQILSVNEAALKILGCETKEEMMARGFDMVADAVLDEDKQVVQKKIEELKEEGDSCSVEYRVRHQNGDILHIMGNVKLLKENGELFYQRFLLDCTEQKLQEKKNAKYQEELIHALTIDYKFVCFFDLDTGVGSTLRNAENKINMSGPALVGDIMLEDSMENYVQRLVHEEDRELMRHALSRERIRQELEEKMTYCVRHRIVRDNVTEYFEMKAVRAGEWEDHFGIVLGFHSVDEETRSEMEQKEILEDALIRANEANRAKSEFLSNMSHDIRTPMNAITGFTALAITHIDRTEQVREYLEKIMTSGNHLLSLINDVLDMSRIESGKIHLDAKPCRLSDIMHSLCNILQADIKAKNQELYVDALNVIHEKVYCDNLRLNQVLLNLISNSIKYTEPGGKIKIRVSEEKAAKKNHAKYVFRIRDNGMGMSEEFLAHIFEPFEREENSTISGIQGTGLGMAITKNIVDMMEGTIEVQSKQRVGSEFKVSFIFRVDSEEVSVTGIPELEGCRALVADYDADSCESVSELLGRIGIHADYVLSEKEAIVSAKQAVEAGEPYRIFVVGWILPRDKNIEIIRQIRETAGEDAIIIVLTSYDWTDMEDKARQAGVSTFCSEPLFMSELKKAFHIVLYGDNGEDEEDDQREDIFHKGRILLAEDVELNQEIAVEILGDAGLETEVAGNGQIAVDMLKASEPGYYQVVLMDIQMPVMNGYEATKAIRALDNKKLASIPILAMSANAFEEDKQEALKCGMNGHIAKPIDVDSMFETLGSVLKRR